MIKTIKVGSDFSGVGAFEYALKRIEEDGTLQFENLFACDLDKFARQTFIENHGEPIYYPKDVYDRKIPAEPLDLYMTSPPCQSFSVSGNRGGKDDKRGILFFNSLEFIRENNPRFFIFENVKGLCNHDEGRTFSEWTNLLGGKSLNGNPVLFPYDGAVNYHLYWTVLNSKDFNIPQNRERVFLVGIRDDEDNNFKWPAAVHLEKRLKDILETDVSDEFFLPKDKTDLLVNKNHDPGQLKINSATARGYETAEFGDSINYTILASKTRRGRVGRGVAQCLDTTCFQAVCVPISSPDRKNKDQNGRRFKENGDPSFTLTTIDRHGIYNGFNIRRLTPRECFRAQDFPDDFIINKSSNQAYKQAGNSISVGVLEKVIRKINL